MIQRRLFALAILSLALASTAASAGRRQSTHFESQSVFVDDTSCAFPIDVNGTDKVTEQDVFDADGNLIAIVFHDQFDATLSANGKTILESDHYTVTVDLVGGTETWTGVPFRVRATRGGRPIQQDAGRIVFADDGSIVVEHGKHPFADGDVAAYCAALAP